MQLIPPPRAVVMEATPAVQNIHVKNKLFPTCEPISTGCATIQLDLQDAMAHDTE